MNEDEFEQAADVIERFSVKATPQAWTCVEDVSVAVARSTLTVCLSL